MMLLYVSAGVCLLALAAVGVVLRVRRYPLDGREKAVVSEAGVTAMLGYLCFLLAGFLVCGKFADPTLGGTQPGSYSLLAALAALCGVTGGFVLLWSYMKKSVAYADRLVQVSWLGRTREIRWSDVQQVKVPMMSRTAVFCTAGGKLAVNGDPKQYKRFIETVRWLVPQQVGSDTLAQLAARL